MREGEILTKLERSEESERAVSRKEKEKKRKVATAMAKAKNLNGKPKHRPTTPPGPLREEALRFAIFVLVCISERDLSHSSTLF